MSDNKDKTVVVRANPERKIFRPQGKQNINKIPAEILNNADLNECISQLPNNYNFEIHKTIWRIKHMNARRVALQMPEGLLMFSITICNIIERFTDADTVIMGDVTYGACCVDDYTAKALGVDLLVHYGHSCLIPVDQTDKVKVLYIFVDIKIDAGHFVQTIKHNFEPSFRLAFFSTIQFVTTLHKAAVDLRKEGYEIAIPQAKPLSPGEILGCTSPVVDNVDGFLYLGDGRFHIESIMIANPTLKAYKYDPYEKKITEEEYDHKEMRKQREECVEEASKAEMFGLILGTLGHQGSPKVFHHLQKKLKCNGKKSALVLLSEVTPRTLSLFSEEVGAWVQTCCPRLSIDWGKQFSRPLLSPYEAAVALRLAPHWSTTDTYPMDFYSSESRGPWTPNHKPSNLIGPSPCDNCCKS